MTEQGSLFAPDDWRPPNWMFMGPLIRASRILFRNSAFVQQAERDGIPQVAPILAVFGADPHQLRKRFGKSVWREIHHSKLQHNVLRAAIKLHTRIPFEAITIIPTGALPEIIGMVKTNGDHAVTQAVTFAKNRTQMREAVMLSKDFMHMGGEINPKWSLNRLRKEHDMKARQWACRWSDPKPFAPPFSCTVNGFVFTRLISLADFAAEGMAMHHCIASYGSRARAGRETAFRIEGEERASVSFGSLTMELRGPCNRSVSKACRDATVQMWRAFKGDAA